MSERAPGSEGMSPQDWLRWALLRQDAVKTERRWNSSHWLGVSKAVLDSASYWKNQVAMAREAVKETGE